MGLFIGVNNSEYIELKTDTIGTQFQPPPPRTGSEETLRAEDTNESPLIRTGSAEWPTTKPRLESHSSSYVVPSLRSNKPILKKRSNSEMMLARHNLAPYGVECSNTPPDDSSVTEPSSARSFRPTVVRTHSASSALRSARKQHHRTDTGGDIPKRRIHFNESVEQCISIIKLDRDDDDYSSSSSDDAPTMRISTPKPPINIAKLPSTTLKLPSPVQGDTSIMPTTVFAEDDSDDEMEIPENPEPRNTYSDGSFTARTSRSNSTDSVILPNYDGYQDDSPPPGIFGRAAEVVSSARDLVSVIWSASGWRRPDNHLASDN